MARRILGALIGLALVGCEATGFTRVDYVNISDRDGTIDYAQVLTGTRVAVTDEIDLDLAIGEFFDLSSEDPETFLGIGGAWTWEFITLSATADLFRPWVSGREFTLGVTLEIEH